MTMTTIERLRLGRERIARGWTRGHYAIDSAGHSVHPDEPSAVAWCAAGALYGPKISDVEVRTALGQTINSALTPWNDDPRRTQADVLKAFDDTIARLEAK